MNGAPLGDSAQIKAAFGMVPRAAFVLKEGKSIMIREVKREDIGF